jgi:hypothetical protein
MEMIQPQMEVNVPKGSEGQRRAAKGSEGQILLDWLRFNNKKRFIWKYFG